MPSTRELLVEDRTDDGVLLLILRNGRLNTLTRPLRSALIEALDRAENDPAIRAIVLRGGDGMFSAGADLTEFDSGQGLAEPTLHGTISDFLDGMRTPVVALIEGLALGGGLELALACHYRIATPDALLGLPEVTFGFLPGAGGTQRLPRAVGLEPGLAMILGGSRLRAEEIGPGGLLAELVDGDVVARAVRFALAVADRPVPRLRDVRIADADTEAFLAFAARTHRGQPEKAAVVRSIAAGLADIDRGFAEEQRLFSVLAESEVASARRHLFLAERAARRRPVTATSPTRFARIGVVGGGTMGRGIALAHALAGFDVTLVEAGDAQLAATHAALADDAARAARSRSTAVNDPAELLDRIHGYADDGALSECDLVIEAVPEIMALKEEVFRRLDAIVRPGTVLATNTSSLDVDRIAAATTRPNEVVGLHFFAPAHVMRLLEIVRGAQTSSDTIAAALVHADRLSKVPVVAGVGPGFIGNRVLEASNREVGLMLLEGAGPEDIDSAMETWGMRMGPLRVLDLVGNDVPMLTREATGRAGDLEWRAAAELVRLGRLGRKTGRGWYRYDGSVAVPDPESREIIRSIATDAGVEYRPPTPREIVERVVLAMVNEGVAALEEGVAARAGDIDVVFAHGYGFPAERGGPMHVADTMGLRNVVRIMRRYAARPGGERWRPRAAIVECAAADRRLGEWEADS